MASPVLRSTWPVLVLALVASAHGVTAQPLDNAPPGLLLTRQIELDRALPDSDKPDKDRSSGGMTLALMRDLDVRRSADASLTPSSVLAAVSILLTTTIALLFGSSFVARARRHRSHTTKPNYHGR